MSTGNSGRAAGIRGFGGRNKRDHGIIPIPLNTEVLRRLHPCALVTHGWTIFGAAAFPSRIEKKFREFSPSLVCRANYMVCARVLVSVRQVGSNTASMFDPAAVFSGKHRWRRVCPSSGVGSVGWAGYVRMTA